jgi:hypothetical protein
MRLKPSPNLPQAPNNIAIGLRDWCATTARLAHRAITTVYAQAPASAACAQPMLALRSGPMHRPSSCSTATPSPARASRPGCWPSSPATAPASARRCSRRRPASRELGLAVQPLLTVTEQRHLRLHRRAAAPPSLHRAGPAGLRRLRGRPLPATLEGAVRSGIAAAAAIAPAALG